MLIGYFDFLIFSLLIFLNIKYWQRNISSGSGCLLVGFLFVFLFPFVSMLIELQLAKPWMDSFEVVYTYLRFPMYWFVGFLQSIVLIAKPTSK